jgi:hypothetical protein
VALRSPREALGGYILLPRLIDKVRLLTQEQLPTTYATNVLGTRFTLDGRFRTFTGLNAEALRQVILSSRTGIGTMGSEIFSDCSAWRSIL